MDITKTQQLYGLYGSHIKRENAVGYCYKHKCHLTIKSMKQHECLRKQCHSLKKHEEHEYWQQRAQHKALKIANKVYGGV